MNDLTLYNFLRPGMQTGDLLAYRSTSVIGTLIHIWSSPYNHVGLVLRLPQYEGNLNRRWTLAADHRGVALSLLSLDLGCYNGEVWWYPLIATDDQREQIAEFALCAAGTPYDYFSLIKNIWGLVPVEMLKYFCSEYVFAAYRNVGLVSGDKAPRPSDLAELPIYEEKTQIIVAPKQVEDMISPFERRMP